MTKNTLTPIKVLCFFLLTSIFSSCTKDSDLFSDVILLDEINDIEEYGTNSSSQEETEVTIDLENGIFETDEDKIAIFNVRSLVEIKNGKSPVLKNIIQPINGQIQVENDSIVRYMPNADFNGTDYFEVTIEVSDGSDTFHEEEVTLEVNVNPIADTVDDIVQVATITEMGINVLNNDTFKDKNNVIISNISEPSHGTVVLNADKSILYTPTSITETDSFNYTTTVIHEDQTTSTEEGVVNLELVSSNNSSTTANLLFSSGFEGSTSLGLLEGYNGYRRFTGYDATTNFSWNETLNGLWGSSNNGIHEIEGGSNPRDEITNELVTMTGHNGSSTRALRIEKSRTYGSIYGGPGSQTPYQINNITNDPDEIYVRQWYKLDDLANDTGFTNSDYWRMIWQYKSDHFDYQSTLDGYRISLFIVKDPETGVPYWRTQADDQNPSYWVVDNTTVPVPTNEWFQFEMYLKPSTGGDGEFWIKINGTEIAQNTGKNLGNSSDSLYFMMLWQFYGNGNGEQWIDDIEIWDGIPY